MHSPAHPALNDFEKTGDPELDAELEALLSPGRHKRSNTVIAAPSPQGKIAPPPPTPETTQLRKPAATERRKSFTFASETLPPPPPSTPHISSVPNSPVHSAPSPIPVHSAPSPIFDEMSPQQKPPPPPLSLGASPNLRPEPHPSPRVSQPMEDELLRALVDLANESREADRVQQLEAWQTQMADMRAQLEAQNALNRELQLLLRQHHKLFQAQAVEKHSLQQQLYGATAEVALLKESQQQAAESQQAEKGFQELTQQLKELTSEAQKRLKKQIQDETEQKLQLLAAQLKQGAEDKFTQLNVKLEEQHTAAITEHFLQEQKKAKKLRAADKMPNHVALQKVPPPSAAPQPLPPAPRESNKEYVFAPLPTPRTRIALERALEG